MRMYLICADNLTPIISSVHVIYALRACACGILSAMTFYIALLHIHALFQSVPGLLSSRPNSLVAYMRIMSPMGDTAEIIRPLMVQITETSVAVTHQIINACKPVHAGSGALGHAMSMATAFIARDTSMHCIQRATQTIIATRIEMFVLSATTQLYYIQKLSTYACFMGCICIVEMGKLMKCILA